MGPMSMTRDSASNVGVETTAVTVGDTTCTLGSFKYL